MSTTLVGRPALTLHHCQDLSNKYISRYAIFTILFLPFPRQAFDERLPEFMDLSNIFTGGGPRTGADSGKRLSPVQCCGHWYWYSTYIFYHLPCHRSRFSAITLSSTSMSTTDQTTENASPPPHQAPVGANE
jgi:hypothetical protein